MSILSLFINGEYKLLLFSAVVLLVVFYALGRIVQRYFRFNKSNIMISIPLGMVFFVIINQLVYAPIIITGFGESMLSIIDTLKAIGIAIVIVISYEAWMPRFSWIGLKSIAFSIISISTVISIYAVFAVFFGDWFATTNTEWTSSIETIFDGGTPTDNPLEAIINSYQSMYYWLYLNSSFGDISIEKVINIQVALVWITSVCLAIQSTIVNNEKTIISYIAATTLSLFAMFVLGYISPTADLFYIMSISIIVMMLLYDYSKRSNPPENTITMALISSLAFITVGANSFLYFLLFGLVTITLSTIRGGNIVNNTITYLMLTVGIFAYYIISLTLHDIVYIRTILLYVILLAIILILMLLPLYSIGYNPSRREELVQFENSIKNRIGTGVVITAIIITSISLFINFTNDSSTIELVKEFFNEFNGFNSSVTLGLILYLSIIFLPSVVILTLWHFGIRSNLLSLFAFINIILNPINASTICDLLNISFQGELILIPSMMIISIYFVGEISKRIPSLH